MPNSGRAEFPRCVNSFAALLCFFLAAISLFAQPKPAVQNAAAAILNISGKVEVLKAGTSRWLPAEVNQALAVGDRVRTGEHGRASVRLTDLSISRLPELSGVEIEPPPSGKRSAIKLDSGSAYFFSREKPDDIQFRTKLVSGATRGTEFQIAVAENGRTVVTLLDGAVVMQNEFGQLTAQSGEEIVVEPGAAPKKSPALNALNTIQWCFYYPGVIDLDEINFAGEEASALAASIAAYREGDLLKAVDAWPAHRASVSDSEKIYFAALLLGVGQVEQAEAQLDSLQKNGAHADTNTKLAGALREIIAAVKFQNSPRAGAPTLASEWLAESYFQQAHGQLEPALESARKSIAASPRFGFGWERVAELEFSFGRIPASRAALEKARQFCPRNAQALALRGFLLSAQNHFAEAMKSFDQAIALDGALGNAWLGRGLLKIRNGQREAGRQDLEMAAALEPNRALLRSYLGKAFSNAGDNKRAAKELALAKKMDAGDPTSWFYSALLNQQRNRINQAVADLEESQGLNNNRGIYRSRLLLDQDRAVRGANLALIYRDAGMTDVSLREASRAVQSDYANYSAHLFLAYSYDSLRDLATINLRYETPAVSEYLVGNLLAPVGGSVLARSISQQEYSRFFEGDRVGLSSETKYFSRGAWEQTGSIYGSTGKIGYAIDSSYRTDPGFRPNNDLEDLAFSAQAKVQLTPQDSAYFQAFYADTKTGDLTQYYNQSNALPDLRTKEIHEPILLAGFHHEWSPGVHTLFLATRPTDEFSVANRATPVLLLGRNADNKVVLIGTSGPTAAQAYRDKIEIYTAELQQIFQRENNSLIFGALWQGGNFDTENRMSESTATEFGVGTNVLQGLLFNTPAISQHFRNTLERESIYAYDNFQIFEPLLLTAGVTYDRLDFPENFRNAPINGREEHRDQVSPKAGVIWTPEKNTVLRAGYTRSLGGVSFDQSFRLEPTQVAGFNQAFRSIIPESVAGATAAPFVETFDAAIEHKFPTRTYVSLAAEMLYSKVDQSVGTFDLNAAIFPPPAPMASSTREQLRFREKTLSLTINQLLGDEWALGASYRISRADLTATFPEIPVVVASGARSKDSATLNQLDLFALYNHRCGFFARADALWTAQDNRSTAMPGDDFWHFNIFAGYRFANRRAEVQLGILNLGDRNYRLNPLNLTAELPRERTFAASVKLNF